MKRKYSKYTDEQILDAIAATPNFSRAAELLDINRKTVMAVARRHGISSKRMREPDHDKVLSIKTGRDGNIAKYLRKHSLMEEVCALCGGLPVWNGQPLTLQLDHIDGNPSDNRIDNLRWLCPNCHSQTPTFTNKKRG